MATRTAAIGMMEIAEVVRQLRGKAGGYQVKPIPNRWSRADNGRLGHVHVNRIHSGEGLIMENQDVVKAYYKMEAEFNWSYGKISRFFKELMENKKIMGTKCPKCGMVFCPPTSDCPKCWVPTEWVEVGPQGDSITLLRSSICPIYGRNGKAPYTTRAHKA